MMLGLSVGLPAARRACCQRRLSCQPAEHAGLRRADRRRAIAPCGSGACHSLARSSSTCSRSRRRRILVLVDHVLVERLRIQLRRGRVHPGTDERRQVQAGISRRASPRRALLIRGLRQHRVVGEREPGTLGGFSRRENRGLISILLRLGAMICSLESDFCSTTGEDYSESSPEEVLPDDNGRRNCLLMRSQGPRAWS